VTSGEAKPLVHSNTMRRTALILHRDSGLATEGLPP